MVTFCFLNWEEKKNSNDSIWRFSDLQWVPAKKELSQKLFPTSQTWRWCWFDVCVCVCVWVGVWYMCVHICIIYISNIYYIYLYHISVERCHGDQPQYICNSFHHPNLSCAFIQDFSCKPSKVNSRNGGRGTRRGDMGNRLILMKSNVCVTGWLRFGFYAKLWRVRRVELPATHWEASCASVVCLVQKMTIYQLSPYLELVQLWKVTVNALLVLSSLVAWLRSLHHHVLSEDAVNRFRSYRLWIRVLQ